jgi:ABC-type multidrug transport system fused ATPase/permease subunit
MEPSKSQKHGSASLAKLLRLAKPHTSVFVLAFITLGAGSAVNLVFPELIRRLLNADRLSWLTTHQFEVGAALIGLFAFQGICFYYRSLLFSVIAQRIVTTLRRQLYSAIISRDIEFFDQNRSGDLVSRLGSDMTLVQDALGIKISVFVRYGLQVIVGVVLMLFLSVRLTIAIVLSLPILVGISILLGKKLKRLSKAQQTELGQASNIAEETFSGVRIVKAFNRENFEDQRFSKSIEAVLALGITRSGVAAFFASFVSFLLNACIVLIMLYGITLVGNGIMPPGDLTAFLLYGVIVAVSFAFIAGGVAEFIQAMGAADRIFEILDHSLPVEPIDKALLASPVRGAVSVKNITFCYPSRPEIAVLKNISFELPAGKTTALVGPSGSGKTTVTSLILGLYPPQTGALRFDNVPIDCKNSRSIREHIAIVPQDPYLFALSIADNLRYGRLEANLDDIREAARKASLLDFIESLPQGFETDVGPRGTQLSGGQKQRLAIARAILRNPALLVLDEATSSLDSENEALIQAALDTLMKGRTALVIAHRLSTIKNAHQVIVLEAGQIVQIGTHDSLSREAGLYRQLVERQELG